MRISIDKDSDFSIHNLPFGIYSINHSQKRVAVAIGEYILDLVELQKLGIFDFLNIPLKVLENDILNDFIGLGKTTTNKVRETLKEFLLSGEDSLWAKSATFLIPKKAITLHLPIRIGDYTDFYSSEAHARNVGKMFRDPENALLPNWKHMPVAYHGRASSIFVSGKNFKRPKGQICADENRGPSFSPSLRLDFELEMATVIGKSTEIGDSITTEKAEEYVFGFLLFNDWSARDIQKWEYVPLGPFLSKNFFSAVSPWVVCIEALEPFREEAPVQIPETLPYLKEKKRRNFNINLEVYLQTKEGKTKLISESNFCNMYWTVAQQIAHHTVGGCNINIGDLMASGTISGESPRSFGSMLEITNGGKSPIFLEDGSERAFVEDGDTIILKGFAEKDGIRVGLGEVRNTVLPNKNDND
jgi:fumarylacetoacetase